IAVEDELEHVDRRGRDVDLVTGDRERAVLARYPHVRQDVERPLLRGRRRAVLRRVVRADDGGDDGDDREKRERQSDGARWRPARHDAGGHARAQLAKSAVHAAKAGREASIADWRHSYDVAAADCTQASSAAPPSGFAAVHAATAASRASVQTSIAAFSVVC